jgi:hypothetical protein
MNLSKLTTIGIILITVFYIVFVSLGIWAAVHFIIKMW